MKLRWPLYESEPILTPGYKLARWISHDGQNRWMMLPAHNDPLEAAMSLRLKTRWTLIDAYRLTEI